MSGASELFLTLLVAGVAGLLIGLEREQSAAPEPRTSFVGGARTHPLVALLGAICALLHDVVGPVAWVVPLVALLAFLLVAYVADVKAGGERGITSEVAFLLSYALGSLAASKEVIASPADRSVLVLSIAVVVTVLLSIKPSLHSIVRRASREDVIAMLKFLVVAVVVLPLLPNETVGPLDVLNPRHIGLLVTLITGLSFAGWVAIRALGAHRGLGLTGLLGGLVSSTAVALTFSGRAHERPDLLRSCALAVTLASAIMFIRMLVLLEIVAPGLVAPSLWPLGGMAIVGLVGSAVFYRRSSREADVEAPMQLGNPVELSSALKFAALFSVVLLASKAATLYLGTGATYLTSILAGTTDVDAITLSMARLARSATVSPEVAVTSIFLGAASNTVVKAVLAIAIGGWPFGWRISTAFACVLAAGAAGLLAVWL